MLLLELNSAVCYLVSKFNACQFTNLCQLITMSLCINPNCPQPQNPDNMLFCQSCGSELLLEGRYRVIRLLGEGGFGKTYEISGHNSTKVLKVLINSSLKAVELFQREAQVLQQLNHPGIPKVEFRGYFLFYPRDSQQSLHCLVMEKIEGLDLGEYIKRRGYRPIDGDLACKWLTQVVTILQAVHQHNLIHRDIKPQNIMLQPDGELVLVDFGTVRGGTGTAVVMTAPGGGTGTQVVTQNVGVGTSINSPGYTPQEQINGQAVPQSDFFALGRTFVFLLTGKEPQDPSIYNGFNDELHWRSYALDVSIRLADLIDRMMARLPSQRPANTQEILQCLAEIDPPLPRPQPIPTPPERQPPSPLPPLPQPPQPPSGFTYAGFRIRFAAFLVDGVFNFVIYCFSILLGVLTDNITHNSVMVFLVMGISAILVGWIYYLAFEISSRQATIGQMVLGIVVADLDGNRISFARASRRYFYSAIWLMIIILGGIIDTSGPNNGYLFLIFLMISLLFFIFSRYILIFKNNNKKQTFHDQKSGCVVIMKNN
jgi:eukaryotic-like serine/threonine-protein kinase